jgi:hypothetical protein
MVVRTARWFAINSDSLPLQRQLHLLNPRLQTALQTGDIQSLEHASDGVVRRDAVRQLKVLSEPVFVADREAFHVSKRVGSADHAAQRNPDDVLQHMVQPAVRSRILQLHKVCKKFKVPAPSHDPDSIQPRIFAASTFDRLTG